MDSPQLYFIKPSGRGCTYGTRGEGTTPLAGFLVISNRTSTLNLRKTMEMKEEQVFLSTDFLKKDTDLWK